MYVLSKVKVEVSGRSLSKPVSEVPIDSMIDQVYPKVVLECNPCPNVSRTP